MKFLFTRSVCGLSAAIALILSPLAMSQTGTPIPTATGPIPVTAESFPQLSVERTQEKVDLAAAGYVEEEFFISGEGNAYDWAADGSISVLESGLPYTTRVIVRRPANAAAFNGNVIVELLNNSRTFDWQMTWGVVHPYVLDSGSAYVGISIRPRGIDSMKKLNPARYEALAFTAPAQACANDAAADRREDLHWDIISQVGALLKTPHNSGPLAGFDVERLYATADDGDLPTYVNAIHAQANLPDGSSIYDGYVYKGNASPVRINACSPAPAEDDPRHADHGANVPVARVLAEGDAAGFSAMRRDDSDAPGDLYRLYEVAGSSHMDTALYRHLPVVEDQVAMGMPPFQSAWPLAYKCSVEMPMVDSQVYRHAMHATFANIDRWVRDGVPAPRAERLALRNPGTEQAEFVFDEYGNAVGGVRSPFLEVPVATYRAKAPGPGVCGNLLRIEPFDWSRLESLYGSHDAYVSKLTETVDRLAQQGWLTSTDAEQIKSAAATGTGPKQ